MQEVLVQNSPETVSLNHFKKNLNLFRGKEIENFFFRFFLEKTVLDGSVTRFLA